MADETDDGSSARKPPDSPDGGIRCFSEKMAIGSRDFNSARERSHAPIIPSLSSLLEEEFSSLPEEEFVRFSEKMAIGSCD